MSANVCLTYSKIQRRTIYTFCRRAGIPRHTNAPKRYERIEGLLREA